MKIKEIKQLADIPQHRNIVLYGAGRGGTRFLEVLRHFRPGLKVEYFIDSFQPGEASGLPVLSLAQFLETKNSRPPVTILVTSLYSEQISRVLITNGIDDFYSVSPVFFYPPEYNTRLTPGEHKINEKEIEHSRFLLTHPRDIELYDILTSRVHGFDTPIDAISHYFYHESIQSGRQYFDFIQWEKVQTIIEGGVFDGKSTLSFLEWTNPGVFIYGFEPNHKNFTQSPYFPRLSKEPRVKIIPSGLWSRSQRLTLTDQLDASGIITDASPSNPTSIKPSCFEIDVVSIDEFVLQHQIERVDFIKMDIEGAEMEALNGASNTIKTHRPQLAISVYHKKEDIFRIPFYLSQLLENYRYRIGHYSPVFCETVWYGIPGEFALSS